MTLGVESPIVRSRRPPVPACSDRSAQRYEDPCAASRPDPRQRRSANRCGPAAREGGTTACSACSVPPCNDTDSNSLYGLWLSRSLVAGESEVDTCVCCRLGPARGDRLLLGEEVEPLDAVCLRAAEQ